MYGAKELEQRTVEIRDGNDRAMEMMRQRRVENEERRSCDGFGEVSSLCCIISSMSWIVRCEEWP